MGTTSLGPFNILQALLSLPQPAFINIPINFLYTVSSVSASNLVSSTWAQDCM